MSLVVIREAYRKAGRVWGWTPPEGVGLDCRLFDGVGSVRVRVLDLGLSLVFDKIAARKFIREHRSVEVVGGRVVLWVLPLSLGL